MLESGSRPRVSSSVHTGFLVMLLEPFELRDYDFTGRERVPVLAWDSARLEYLDKSRIRGRRLARVVGHHFDHVVDHFPGALDPLSWDAATMRVAQQVATCLRKLRRIGGLGHAD